MWRASITVKGQAHNLGYFHDEEEAARAYDAQAHGLGRHLNFPARCEDDSEQSEVRDQACSKQANALSGFWLDVSAAPTAPQLG